MINNVLQYIYNVTGSLIDQNLGSAKRLSNLVSTLQVISPLPETDSCMATTMYATGRQDTIFLRIAKNNDGTIKKGSQVVDPSKQYYQTVANYNVWEIEIPDYILANISKFSSGKILVSYTFRELVSAAEGTNYKGTFGTVGSTTGGDIPTTGTFVSGDYYTCLGYNYTSALIGQIFTYQEAAYYDGTEWLKGTSFTLRSSTASGIIPVDLAMNGLPPQAVDSSLTEQIIDRIATLEGAVLNPIEGTVVDRYVTITDSNLIQYGSNQKEINADIYDKIAGVEGIIEEVQISATQPTSASIKVWFKIPS